MDSPAMALPSEAANSVTAGKAAGSKTKAKKTKEKDPNAPIKQRRKKSDKNNNAAKSGMGESQGDETGSRSGSIVPGQASLGDSGGNTPTKRKPSGKPSRGRGGGGRRTGSSRQDSRGSRGTSTRASTSIAPGQRAGTQPQQEEEEEDFGGETQQQQQQQPEEDDEIEDDEEEEEEEGAGTEQGLEEEEWQRQEAIQKARSIAMVPLMKAMDEVQQDRYSAYRTSFLDKRHVKRLILHLTGHNTTKQVNTLTASIARIFVGEIVESARKIQEARGANGPLRPEHLLEAHRLYKEEREVPGRYPPGTPSASAGVAGNGKRRRLF